MLRLESVVILLCIPSSAFAWNATGHSVIALLAYRQLSEQEQAKIQIILKAHPHYDSFLTKNIPEHANRDEWVVMQASVWPDWIKGASREERARYNRSNWHYVNIPIRKLDGTSEQDRKTIEDNIADTSKDRGQILVMIPNALVGLKDSRSTDQERAIHLCWVLHLIGDLHQPLHAATLFSKDSLDGDLGGNLFFVQKNSIPQRLHGLWDDALGQLQGFAALDELARVIHKRSRIIEPRVGCTDPKRWAEESHALAYLAGYSYQGIWLVGEMTADFATQPRKPPPLPDGYETLMKEIAFQRVALAGDRLAHALRQALP